MTVIKENKTALKQLNTRFLKLVFFLMLLPSLFTVNLFQEVQKIS